MNLIKRQNTALVSYHQPGLGFLGIKWGKWAKKAVGYLGDVVAGAVKTFIPIFGAEISDKIKTWAAELGTSLEKFVEGLGSPELDTTAAEEAILNQWLQLQFTPFVEGLVAEVAHAMNLPSQTSQIIALNAVLNKINAVNDHYLVDSTDGLSMYAREQRTYVIFQAFEPVVQSVQLAVMQLGIDATIMTIEFNLNSYDYTPLFKTSIVTKVKGDNYKLSRINSIAKPIQSVGSTPIGTKITNVKPAVNLESTKVNPVKGVINFQIGNQTVSNGTAATTSPVTFPTTNPASTIKTPEATVISTPVATNVENSTTTESNTPTTMLPLENVAKTDEMNGNGSKTKTGLYVGLGLLALAIGVAIKKKKAVTRKPSKK